MVKEFDIAKIRKDFPILHQEVNGKPLVYLDNGATVQKPQAVIDSISNYYETINANVHRGVHSLSQWATDAMEEAREKVRAYINAPSIKEVIFTSGTTDGINIIASSFTTFVEKGDEILISTNKGRVIRVAVKEIRTAGRNTQGVRIIKLSGEEKVVSADKIDDNLV